MTEEKTEKEILLEISDKLDKLIGLSAIQGKTKEEQIKILHQLGFTSKAIGMFTGIPEGTVGRIRSTKLKGGK